LKNQGATGGKPEREDPGKEEPEFFEPAAETGSLRSVFISEIPTKSEDWHALACGFLI